MAFLQNVNQGSIGNLNPYGQGGFSNPNVTSLNNDSAMTPTNAPAIKMSAPLKTDTVAFGGNEVKDEDDSKNKNNKTTWLVVGGVALAAIGIAFHKNIAKMLGLGKDAAKNSKGLGEEAVNSGKSEVGDKIEEATAKGAGKPSKGMGEEAVSSGKPEPKSHVGDNKIEETTAKGNEVVETMNKKEVVWTQNTMKKKLTQGKNGQMKEIEVGGDKEGYYVDKNGAKYQISISKDKEGKLISSVSLDENLNIVHSFSREDKSGGRIYTRSYRNNPITGVEKEIEKTTFPDSRWMHESSITTPDGKVSEFTGRSKKGFVRSDFYFKKDEKAKLVDIPKQIVDKYKISVNSFENMDKDLKQAFLKEIGQ